MRNISVVIITTLFSLTMAAAQNTASLESKISVNCGSLPSRSCQSFRELIEAKDELLNTVASTDETFVCMDSDEDRFSVIYFDLPTQFWLTKANGFEEQVGSVHWEDFQNGSPADFHFTYGRWNKPKDAVDGAATLVGQNKQMGDATKVFITSTDLTMSDTFPNRIGTQTLSELTIRRSTGRYTKSLSWRDPHHGNQVIDVAGHCLHYHKGVLLSGE